MCARASSHAPTCSRVTDASNNDWPVHSLWELTLVLSFPGQVELAPLATQKVSVHELGKPCVRCCSHLPCSQSGRACVCARGAVRWHRQLIMNTCHWFFCANKGCLSLLCVKCMQQAERPAGCCNDVNQRTTKRLSLRIASVTYGALA
jgi:hypothetical protein